MKNIFYFNYCPDSWGNCNPNRTPIPAMSIVMDGINGNSYFLFENFRSPWYQQYDLELGKTYQITIKQFKASETYWYEIIIDGESKFKIEIPEPKSYSNVRAYTSYEMKINGFDFGMGLFYDPFTSDFGSVCNFKVQQGQE